MSFVFCGCVCVCGAPRPGRCRSSAGTCALQTCPPATAPQSSNQDCEQARDTLSGSPARRVSSSRLAATAGRCAVGWRAAPRAAVVTAQTFVGRVAQCDAIRNDCATRVQGSAKLHVDCTHFRWPSRCFGRCHGSSSRRGSWPCTRSSVRQRTKGREKIAQLATWKRSERQGEGGGGGGGGERREEEEERIVEQRRREEQRGAARSSEEQRGAAMRSSC